MNPRTTRRCAGLICLFVALSDVGYAAQAESTQAREYSIQPGPLGDTLAQFAAMSNVQLLFEPTIVAGLRSDGLQGAYTVEAGFARILEASGYEIVKREEGVYALVARSDSAGVKTMRKVRVEAESKSSATATDPVVGYVARRTATATKTDTPLVEIPQAINVVTRDEIAARGGARTISDALAYTPGFFNSESVNTRGDTGGSLRGFGASSSLFLDGLRLPNAVDGARAQVEPFGIESIEVLKGPSSVYGQNAPGGLISLVSKRPTAEPLGEIYLAGGTFSRLEGGVDVSSSLNDSLLYRLNGMVRRSDTQIDYVEDNRTYVAPSLTWIVGPKTRLTLLGHAQQDSGGEFCNELLWVGVTAPYTYGRLPRNRFMGDPDANQYDRRQYAAGYAFEHRFNDAVKIEQDFRYLQLDVDAQYLTSEVGRLYNPHRINRNHYSYDASIDSYNLDTRFQIDAATAGLHHHIVAGADYGRVESASVFGSYAMTPPLDPFAPVYGQLPDEAPWLTLTDGGSSTRRGAYLQDQLKLGHWAVTLGGRYDWADSLGRGDAFTRHAGVVYSLGSIVPYVSWSESFEPLESLSATRQPLTGVQIETGVKWQPDPRTLITVAVFELKQQNIVTNDPDTFDAIQIGESRVRGVEVEAKANLDRWDLSVSYAYADAEVSRSNDVMPGTALPDNPHHQAALWSVYKLPFIAGLDVGGGVRYTGSFYGGTEELWENASVTLFDLTLGYDLGRRFGAESLRLSLNARNVADKEYVYCDGRSGCRWGAQRTLQVAARYIW